MDFYLVALLAIIISVVLWVSWRKNKFTIFSRNSIPGPKPSFWTGNFTEFLEKKEMFAYEYTKQYGNVFGYFFGGHPVLTVTDPELIKIIQVKEVKLFTNRNLIIPKIGIPHPVMEEAIIVQNDDNWRKTRSILSPSFSTGKMKKMSQIMNDGVDEFLENVDQKSRNKEIFDIFPNLKELTLDIISRAAFGVNTGVQKGKHSLLLDSIQHVFGADPSNIITMLSVCFPELEPIPTKLSEMCDAIKNFFGYPSVGRVLDSCQNIIKQRKLLQQKRNDLLQSMIDGKIEWKKYMSSKYKDLTADHSNADHSKEEDEQKTEDDSNVIKLTDGAIKANAVLFMAAGYDTTSSTLAFVCYLLSTHPNIQEKVRNEIIKVVGGKKQVEYDDLHKLQYLDQVISETLRLYPLTSVTITRGSKQEYKYNGMTIPKGIVTAIPLWTLHKNPDIWNDPDEFIPERFSPENKDRINATNYQPFGNGPRNCIGMRFAQTVMKFTLSRLLLSYRLEYCSDEEFQLRHMLIFIHPRKVMIRAVPLNG